MWRAMRYSVSDESAMFATLRAPDFALQVARRVALRAGTMRVGDRVALIDDGSATARSVSDRGWIMQADADARACGIEAGMSATRALARHAGLVFLRREAAAEQLTSRRMLGFAEKLSPRFEATSPGVVTIDLTAVRLPATSAELRSHAADLLRKAREQCALEFLTIGLAGSPETAMLAALRADPVCVFSSCEEALVSELGGLPLADLSPDPKVAGVLATWGIVTVAQLVALPRDAVTRRLGATGAKLWDRAAGRGDRLLDLQRERRRYLRVQEIEFPVDSLEPLLFLLRRVLEELLAEVASDYLVVVGMRLVLGFVDGNRWRSEIRLPEASCDADLLHRVLHSQLEGVSASAPLDKVSLELLSGRQIGRQSGLFGNGIRDPYRLVDTLAQIDAVLGEADGDSHVGCPEAQGGHRPDAFLMRPFLPRASSDDPGAGVEEGADFSASFEKREIKWGLPIRRLRPPEPIQVLEATRGGSPAEIRSGRFCGRIRAHSGPWISSGNWWGKHTWKSEEWDIELEKGGLLRITRHGKGKWQLEGIYG